MAPSKANKEKAAKACRAMKPFGISAETVKSTLKRLLKAYENNWMYVEEDNYRVLLDAIFEPEASPKTTDTLKHDFKLHDEPEEEGGGEEAEPLLKKARLFQIASSSECLLEGEKLLALEYKNNESMSNEDEEESKNEVVSPCSSEIDIASSPNGEVKLTFSICKPPQGFRIPNLDAVMKKVEDMYRERFQVFGTEFRFSLSELLQDICICFMEQGDCSNVNKQNPVNDSIQTPTRFVVSSEFVRVPFVDVLNSGGNCSSSLTILPNEQLSADFISKCNQYWVADITRGLEKQEISLINEFNDERRPDFTYIQTNVNYKTANVKFLLARISDENCCFNCFGDCLSPEQVPCACAAETGGEFAYTTEGLLNEKFLKNCIDICLKPTKMGYFYCDNCPLERMKKGTQSGSCKGHLVRKFIKECWYKCGCGINCGNRVVQRGIQANLQVFMTPEGKGWGVRTLEDLPKGIFVCEYVGEIVTNSELFERNEENKDKKHTYPVLLDADWSSEGFLKDEEALCLDATSFGNVARFINHRCEDANMVEVPVEVESPDHHYYHHAFFTTREVKAMEELTWDYGIDFDDDTHPVKAFQCKCGSKSCRAIKHRRRKSKL